MFDIPSTLKDLDIPIEFKNFKEVAQCFNLLDKNDKPFAGNTKKAAVAELQRYCNFDKTNNGNKWLITEVYNEPKEVKPRKVRADSIYAKAGAIIILADLYLFDYRYAGTAEYTRSELYKIFNLFNKAWYSVCYGDQDDLLECFEYSDEFIQSCKSKFNDIIRSSISCLKSRYQVIAKNILVGVVKEPSSPKRVIPLTQEEEAILMRIKNEVMHDFGFTNMKQLLYSHEKDRDYYAFCAEVQKRLFAETGRIKYTYTKIQLIYNYDKLILGIKDLCQEIADDITKDTVSVEQYKRSQELTNLFAKAIIEKARKKCYASWNNSNGYHYPESYIQEFQDLVLLLITNRSDSLDELIKQRDDYKEDVELGLIDPNRKTKNKLNQKNTDSNNRVVDNKLAEQENEQEDSNDESMILSYEDLDSYFDTLNKPQYNL